MTKLDFAIHLLSTVRLEVPGRFSPIVLLAMLELSRQPDEWKSSTDLAPSCGLESNKLAASLVPGVDNGWLDRRKEGHAKSTVDWKLTTEGRAFLARLLNPQPVPA